MENIRQTLKLLFLRKEGEEVISSLKGVPDYRSDIFISEDWFKRAFREETNCYSLDQLSAIVQLLQTKWMKHNPNNMGMLSAPKLSVFNVLSHFSAEVLHKTNGQPVCCYDSLLRWNDISACLGEDLFTTSFLALKDLETNGHRRSFTWKAIIDHDNTALNMLYEKRMADIHFHLKGSSLNFELNWLSLMNNINHRDKEFKKMQHFLDPQKIYADKICSSSLYVRVAKATAIRYWLFQCIITEKSLQSLPLKEDKKLLYNILNASSLAEIKSYLSQLNRKIEIAKLLYGKNYHPTLKLKGIADYANIIRINEEDGNNPIAVLGGERFFMYEFFRGIYGGEYAQSLVPTLFYAYLLIKAEFRKEIVQLNEKQGFANFAEYEERKSLFITKDSIYEHCLPLLAVSEFFLSKNKNRYLELRIVPKEQASKLNNVIKQTDADIMCIKKNSDRKYSLLELNRLNLPRKTVGQNWEYYYILHFIKNKDEMKGYLLDWMPRHAHLRKKIKKQTKAIYKWRKTYKDFDRVVGIDAANSEIFCRPEVFAQAFRFLRDYPVLRSDKQQTRDIGLTFHVGEDFLDLVDGLRAIDEVLCFMNFRHGDRLGHALALGIDVEEYYSSKHNTVAMPKQVFLDNIAWLYVKGSGMQSMTKVADQLQSWYESIFRAIYKDIHPIPSIRDYYQSWLLRGDNPECYLNLKADLLVNSGVDPWTNYNLNEREDIKNARRNPNARELYRAYHYDASVKQNGEISDQMSLPDSLIHLIKEIQREMVFQIEKINICVEANPTSNIRIGGFNSYLNHPINKLFNLGLNTENERHLISTSINTDDKGVFSTSLEREFSLLAAALEKQYKKGNHKNPPRVIYEWLDKIREMAFEQKFHK